MKRFSEQLHTKAQSLKLKKSEQADLRERIVSYMEYHPLPADMKAQGVKNLNNKTKQTTVLHEPFHQYAIPFHQLFKWGSVAAVFVLVVIPFMAERTVPGDTLYAVKVQFNEEVRSTLTWGSYEKVEWETERLNRRIAEARLLADEGLLTEEVEAEVAAAVKEHSDSAKREIEVLRASDADEAAIATIAFESSLEVQSQALEEDENDETADSTRTGMLISEVLDESRADIPQAASSSVPAYAKLMARVELNTTRVLELRDTLSEAATEQELADINRRIEDINRAVADAIALASSENTEVDARHGLVDVLVRTQKLIVFMTELEVREEVTIEEVVPVVPTDDEIDTDRAERTSRLEADAAAITLALETIEDEDVLAKVSEAMEQIVATLEILPQIETHEVFVAEHETAQALATDVLSLFEPKEVEAIEDVVLPSETSTSTATSTDEVVVEQPDDTATTTDVTGEEIDVVDPVDVSASSTEVTSGEFDETL